MIFDVPTIIASLSAGLTLESADIIATGTPAGVGFSFKPPRFLNDGDVVVARIEGIGQLMSPVERS
jgi:2-keto-4-pentenoate hydratase/2-oxohepta-3-ene-1,7-dioic acid hydratase in catechol pathway